MPTLPTTQRGFTKLEFSDSNGVKCSLQHSSSAMQACIWLGCDDADPQVLQHGKGWSPVPMPDRYIANTRMHLNQQMVTWLLPYLQHFAATGRLEQAAAPKPVGYMAFGIGDAGQDVPLYDYAGFSEDEVGRKIMLAAQYQGYEGDMTDLIKSLGWTIRPIFS